MVLGIIGGIGAGKSLVVNLLQGMTCAYVIDVDQLGHALLLKDSTVYNTLVKTFGQDILDSQNNISRPKLGNIVFSDKDKLLQLNSITHPAIFKTVESLLDNPHRYTIIDAALLIEIGLINLVDKVIGVYADEAIRIDRIMKRNGFSYLEAKKRINNQKTWEDLEKVIDIVVNNNGDINNTKCQLLEIIEVLHET
ncbi:MAG: dephospho-CoA kinase [Epulopiscium sp. Nuni2H_MBin003]|nr:MAG: dephospho-CoA kinase [Epulopiscium sp. Nuni2H_MBin003]